MKPTTTADAALSDLAAISPDAARLALRDVDNWAREDMDEHWLDATTVLLHHKARSRGSAQRNHWWLLCDGVAVAFCSTLTYDREDYPHILCDIEVQATHRGQGRARQIVEAANSVTGEVMHTSGGFTPLGAQALKWLPVLPWETPGVKFSDQSFVADWTNLNPI